MTALQQNGPVEKYTQRPAH